MDLDKIKKNWNNLDSTSLTDNRRVQDIIHSKAKTTLLHLINTEIAFLLLIVLVSPLPVILDNVLPMRLQFPVSTKWIYILFCLSGIIWQGYKLYLLNKIDIIKNGILLCTKYILKYRQYLNLEIWAGSIFILFICGSLLYTWKSVLSVNGFIILCAINAGLWILISFCLYYIYKKGYYTRIKEIENSLREIEITEIENG